MIQLLLRLHKSIGGYQLQSQSPERVRSDDSDYGNEEEKEEDDQEEEEEDDEEEEEEEEDDKEVGDDSDGEEEEDDEEEDNDAEGDHEDEDEDEDEDEYLDEDDRYNYEDIRSILPPYRQTEIKLHRGSQFCGTTCDARWFIMAKLEYEGQETLRIPQGRVTLWNPVTGFVLWLPPLQTIPCFGKFIEDLVQDKNLNISNFVEVLTKFNLITVKQTLWVQFLAMIERIRFWHSAECVRSLVTNGPYFRETMIL